MTAMMEISNQENQISTEKYLSPLVMVLDESGPKTKDLAHRPEQNKQFLQSLNDIFPEQEYEEKDLQKAKVILGKLSEKFTPQELKDIVIEVQFLTESWLDDFERDIFNGLTLRELLHEKGGL